MIGRVIWQAGDVEMVAVLEDDGYWTCEDQVVQFDLNSDLNCDDYSPADGRRGYKQLHLAAIRTGGRIEAPELPDPPSDLVY